MWIPLKALKSLDNSTLYCYTGPGSPVSRAPQWSKGVCSPLSFERRKDISDIHQLALSLFFSRLLDLAQFPPQTHKLTIFTAQENEALWSQAGRCQLTLGRNYQPPFRGKVTRPPIIPSSYTEKYQHTDRMPNLFQIDLLSHGWKLWPMAAHTFHKQACAVWGFCHLCFGGTVPH